MHNLFMIDNLNFCNKFYILLNIILFHLLIYLSVDSQHQKSAHRPALATVVAEGTFLMLAIYR